MIFPVLMTHNETAVFLIITWIVLVALIGLMRYDAYQTHKETKKVIEEAQRKREERIPQDLAVLEEIIGFWAEGFGYFARKYPVSQTEREE